MAQRPITLRVWDSKRQHMLPPVDLVPMLSSAADIAEGKE